MLSARFSNLLSVLANSPNLMCVCTYSSYHIYHTCMMIMKYHYNLSHTITYTWLHVVYSCVNMVILGYESIVEYF